MNKTKLSRPAYSLVFAFLIMTVMMVVGGSAIQNTNKKLQIYNDLGSSAQAYLAAQSAAEQGILTIQDTNADGDKDYSPGFEDNQSEAFCADSDGDGDCNSWGDYRVIAEASDNGDYFYAPIFGTGTAGNSEECSIFDYIDPDDGSVIDPTGVDVDHVCNWNKLLYGQSVTIPLFDTDDSSGAIVTPGDMLSFSDWNLRMRTPCNDDTMDSDCTRYELNADDGSVVGEGDTVVLWQLIGVDSAGNEVSLVPEDDPGYDDYGDLSRAAKATNTEVYESLINNAYLEPDPGTDFIVLNADSSTRYESLLNFCIGDMDNDGTPETTLTSLYLQLNIVTPLKDENGDAIPYLEWQLQVDSPYAFADNKSVMIGQGYFQGLSNLYYNAYVISRSTTGESSNVYTLSN